MNRPLSLTFYIRGWMDREAVRVFSFSPLPIPTLAETLRARVPNVSLKREDYQYHFATIEVPFSQGLSNGSSLAIHPR